MPFVSKLNFFGWHSTNRKCSLLPFLLFVFEKFMAAIDRDRVDQLHTESFSSKLIIAEDQKVIDRTLLRWRNSNDFVDPQCHRGTDRASSGSDAQGAYYLEWHWTWLSESMSRYNEEMARWNAVYPLPAPLEGDELMEVLGEYCKENAGSYSSRVPLDIRPFSRNNEDIKNFDGAWNKHGIPMAGEKSPAWLLLAQSKSSIVAVDLGGAAGWITRRREWLWVRLWRWRIKTS